MKTAEALKRLMAGAFSAMFLVVAASLAVLSVADFVRAFVEFQDKELISGIVRAINTAFISHRTVPVSEGWKRQGTAPGVGTVLRPDAA